MKTIITKFSFFLLLFAFTKIQAQISEGEKTFSLGTHNALALSLPNTTPKYAQRMWKEYIKPYKGDYKSLRKDDTYLLDNAVIPEIGGSNIGGAVTVDLYSRFDEAGSNTIMIIWVDLGGTWVNSNEKKSEYNETEKLMLRFGLQVARQHIQDELDQEEKEQSKIESTQRKLEKENEGLHKDIDNWRAKIKRAEADIDTNLKNQESNKHKLDDQMKKVDSIKKKLEAL